MGQAGSRSAGCGVVKAGQQVFTYLVDHEVVVLMVE